MTGVEILNETQVVAESAFGWTAFWIASSIIFGIFIIIRMGVKHSGRRLHESCTKCGTFQ